MEPVIPISVSVVITAISVVFLTIVIIEHLTRKMKFNLDDDHNTDETNPITPIDEYSDEELIGFGKAYEQELLRVAIKNIPSDEKPYRFLNGNATVALNAIGRLTLEDYAKLSAANGLYVNIGSNTLAVDSLTNLEDEKSWERIAVLYTVRSRPDLIHFVNENCDEYDEEEIESDLYVATKKELGKIVELPDDIWYESLGEYEKKANSNRLSAIQRSKRRQS